MRNERRSWRELLDLGSTLLVSVAAVVLLVWIGLSLKAPPATQAAQSVQRTRPNVPVPDGPLALRDTPLLGEANAPVGLLIFSDFQCPFCGRFARESLASVIRSHVEAGKLFVGFRHVPIAAIHPMAVQAAQTAECGRQQGRFWAVHDALFRDDAWVKNGFEPLLSDVSADVPEFRRCMKNPDTIRRVQADLDEARRLGVASTPTLFFGWADGHGQFVVARTESGAISAAALEAAINEVAETARR